MAIDTAAKRLSAVNIGCPWRPSLPIPDGTISAADRQVVLFLYSGILAAGENITLTFGAGLLRRRRRSGI